MDRAHYYGRPMLSGPFFATGQYGNFTTPGNVEVLVSGAKSQDMQTNRAVIASMDDPFDIGPSAPSCWDKPLKAIWFAVGGSGEYDPGEYDRARAMATYKNCPMLIYYDGYGNIHDNAVKLMTAGDWVGVMAYPYGSEATNFTINRVYDVISNISKIKPHNPIAIIRPLYTRSGQWSVHQILDIQRSLTHLIRETPKVVADLWFAWGRPSGITSNEEFEIEARGLAAGAVGPMATNVIIEQSTSSRSTNVGSTSTK